MKISNPQLLDHIIEKHSDRLLRLRVYDLGVWNMDTTTTVLIAHGLTNINICSIETYIIDDAQNAVMSLRTPINMISPAGSAYVDGINLRIERMLGGFFDAVNYSALPTNRGWCSIWYFD